MRLLLLHHLQVHLFLVHLDHLLLRLIERMRNLMRMHLMMLMLHLVLQLVLRKRMAVFVHDESGVIGGFVWRRIR